MSTKTQSNQQIVVVESPTKAETIERYLGEGYRVMASYGHVRDLPKSDFAIDTHNGDVELTYEVPSASKKHVASLRKAAGDADKVWLALDLDREGEAIAWHVADLLGLDLDDDNRVVFDEITQDAILEAFAQPRSVNRDLVDAQQARRAVDRIVGYRLSPVLWRTVAAGISAGRVQSVALRLIVDREREIRAFVEDEYWSFDGDFLLVAGPDGESPEGRTPPIEASLHTVGDRRLATARDMEKAEESDSKDTGDYLLVDNADDAAALRARAEAIAEYHVREVRRTERTRRPAAPFITSTLQQEAARKLGFSARKTMTIAQQLYEGISLGSEGQTGLITYMRTDSVNLSDQALGQLMGVVEDRWGEPYQLDKPRYYQTKSKAAQEAHEAIRPTDARREPDAVARYLGKDQRRLYELIWKRSVATQMANAVMDRLSADIVGTEEGTETDDTQLMFRATGQVIKFDGFMAVYLESEDDDGDSPMDDELPDLEEDQILDLDEIEAVQHFTQPPPRYSEASLVKALESEGIGRPSTYASIISTIRNRDYVDLDRKRFVPTPLGEVVTAFLKTHFAEIVDVKFTARMEETLDEVARGSASWSRTVQRFLDEVDQWVAERKPERPRLPLDEDTECPECGAEMEKVFSGKSKQWFASCSRWPDCEGTLPLDAQGRVTEPEDELEPDERVPCPKCETPMVLRDGKYGEFYGCPRYPDCDGIVNVAQRTRFSCPKCEQGRLDQRTSKYGKPFVGCNRYPDCDFAVWALPLREPCPTCGAPLKPPPKNRKTPVATCTHPDEQHSFELDDFDQPRVITVPAVEGVTGLDPELDDYEHRRWDEIAAAEDETVGFVTGDQPDEQQDEQAAASA